MSSAELLKKIAELELENRALRLENNQAKQLSEQLQISEARFQNCFEMPFVGIIVFSPESKILQVNNEFCKMSGYPKTELTGRYLFDLTHPDDLEIEKNLVQRLILNQTNFDTIEKRLRSKGGLVIWTKVSMGSICKSDGSIDYMVGYIQDISTSKRALLALIKSEEKFSKAFQNSPDLITITTLDEGIVIEANGNILNLLGYQKEEVIGTSAFDMYLCTRQLDKYNFVTKIKNSGHCKDFETNLRKKSGEIINVSVSGEIIELEEVKCILLVIHDISDRKRAEKALIESESRFRNLLQSVPSVSVQGYSADGTTQYWNKASEALYGYSAEEAIGKKVFDLIIPPELLEFVKQDVGKMIESGQPIPSSELNLMRKDGSLVSVYSSHAIIHTPNGEPEMFCIDIDLTERKRVDENQKINEARYRLLAENMVDVIWTVNPEGKFSYISPSIEKLTGYSVSELVDQDPFFSFTPDTLKKVQEALAWVMSKIKSNTGYYPIEPLTLELEQIKKDGTLIWTEAVIKALIDDHGTLNGFLGVSRDITERRKKDEALRENEARLHALNMTKDKFFSIIAHDLRSPFNSILGFSNLIVERIQDKDYDEIADFARIIQDSSERYMMLLMNLLEWSRSQTGKMEYSPDFFEITSLIHDVIALFTDAAYQKSIRIQKQIPRTAIVLADKDMIATILRNLISNALKFTQQGGEVTVSFTQSLNETVICVCDNGVGIDRKSIPRLFSLEDNFSTRGTQNEHGTGLGLILCRELAERQGGKIWVESEKGKGSKFYCSFPVIGKYGKINETI